MGRQMGEEEDTNFFTKGKKNDVRDAAFHFDHRILFFLSLADSSFWMSEGMRQMCRCGGAGVLLGGWLSSSIK